MSHLIERNLGLQQNISIFLFSGELNCRPCVRSYRDYWDNQTQSRPLRACRSAKEMSKIHQVLKRNHLPVRSGDVSWRKQQRGLEGRQWDFIHSGWRGADFLQQSMSRVAAASEGSTDIIPQESSATVWLSLCTVGDCIKS